MSNYISREAAIEAVREELGCETCNGSNVGTMCMFCNVGNAILLIKNIPAADVEPVRRGWWDVNRRCSECGNPAPLAYSKPDRKMDLEGENNENFSK